ncbi:MAG: cytidylate kinase-like family protein [Bacteroidales bacterium]|nr:cytidylate kinase-like family protein [Bacteroidales bacterium]
MNLNEPFVITISREIGSGGHTVGAILAKRLNTRYCDNDLIKSLVSRFHLTANGIEKIKGEKKNWLADLIKGCAPMPSSRLMGGNPRYTHEYYHGVTTDDIYAAEKEILQELAQEGSCIIAGRSGFHIFKDHPNRLNVFITSSEKNRVKRVMKKQGINDAEATVLIRRIDESRENYIKRYTDTSRYDARNYDLVINMDALPNEEAAVDVIMKFIG